MKPVLPSAAPLDWDDLRAQRDRFAQIESYKARAPTIKYNNRLATTSICLHNVLRPTLDIRLELANTVGLELFQFSTAAVANVGPATQTCNGFRFRQCIRSICRL